MLTGSTRRGGDATAAALSARAEQLQSFYLSYEKIRPSIDPPQPWWIAGNRQRRPLRVPHYNRCNRQEPFGDADGAPAVVRAEPVLRKTNPTSSQFIPMSHQHQVFCRQRRICDRPISVLGRDNNEYWRMIENVKIGIVQGIIRVES